MMTLHQFLESSLDVAADGAVLQPERVERLAFGVAQGAPFRLGARLCRAEARTTKLPQNVERICRAEALIKQSADLSLGAALAADHPHPPSRKMSGQRVLLKARDRIIAHASKKIIGLIVFSDMLEAEPPVFA